MYGWTHELVALLANYGSILYIVAFLPMVRLLYCTVLYCTVLYCTVHVCVPPHTVRVAAAHSVYAARNTIFGIEIFG